MTNEEKLYYEKEEHLKRFSRDQETVAPMDFYRDIFPWGSLEREGSQRDERPNGFIFRLADRKHTLITDELTQIEGVLGERDIIISPVAYFGQRPTLYNASELFAFAIDIDGVEMEQLVTLSIQIKNKFMPRPTYIVNSGQGIHLYFVLEHPLPMYRKMQKNIKTFKNGLVEKLWNGDTSTIKKKQYGSIIQGFRAPGTQSKIGASLGRDLPITAYRVGDLVLEEGIQSIQSLVPSLKGFDIYKHGRLTLDEAKEKYPDWYQSRIVEGKRPQQWTIKRDLYDWWKLKIEGGAEYHHRYYCIRTLAMYARKCGVSKKELEKDAYAFIPLLTTRGDEPFTEADVKAALNAFNGKYVMFPRYQMEKDTAIPMPPNKRNGRKQEQHMKIMSAVRDVLYPDGSWRGHGRPDKRAAVEAYLAENPTATNYRAAKDLGVSPHTVAKYRHRKSVDEENQNSNGLLTGNPQAENRDDGDIWTVSEASEGGSPKR